MVRVSGRPSSFKQEIFDEILTKISNGESLINVLRENKERYPVYSTFTRWLAKDEREKNKKNLRTKYTRARQKQAEFHANEIINIADNCGVFGNEVAKARLQIDTRKWVACKLLPKVYGEKKQVEITGNISIANSIHLFDKRIQSMVDVTPKTKEIEEK